MLISRKREKTSAIARLVHGRKCPRSVFIVVDCGHDEARVAQRLMTGFLGSPSRGRTVFLEDVDLLTPPMQALVASQFACSAARDDANARVQVIASTSVSLLGRTNDGTFDEQLFYRLNTIHIVV